MLELSFSWVSDPQQWITLVMLATLEIVLGIDNIVFISIITDHLQPEQKRRARRFGLALALISRLLLLGTLAWMAKLTAPLFEILGTEISWRDLILILGGLFLIYKATHEIHKNIEAKDETKPGRSKGGVFAVMMQIMVIDIIFSLDSIITAVGLADNLMVMVIAVVMAVIVMMLAVNPICNFIESHPTIKMLALSFLILIGVALIADGLDFHIPRGYIYFAMGFSITVEVLNIMARRQKTS